MTDPAAMAAATIGRVEEVANQWAADFVAKRKANIIRQRLRQTGALHDSVRYDLRRRGDQRWVVKISYNFYGKFHDRGIRKDMPKGGKRYAEQLTEWVKRRGLSNFTPRRGGTIDQVARDIAWGIIRSNAGKSPWRRRQWLNPMRPDVDELDRRIEEFLPDVIVQDVVKVLEA
jgi:hypothetical protein